MLKKAYLGVTGFTTQNQIKELMRTVWFDERSDPNIMIGVLMSNKTIKGLPTKYLERYPEVQDIPNIFTDHPNCFNVVHFHTDQKEDLHGQAMEAIMTAGPLCHGIQLNQCWPDPAELTKFRVYDSKSSVILQIGARAMQEINNNPDTLVDVLSEHYLDLVDYILLDPSDGQGKDLDVNVIDSYLYSLYENDIHKKVRIGFAGGLNSNRIPDLIPLFAKYPDLSIDAEGKLRDPATDELIMTEVLSYISAASWLTTVPTINRA